MLVRNHKITTTLQTTQQRIHTSLVNMSVFCACMRWWLFAFWVI